MPGNPSKQHRLRVKTADGKPRDQGAINRLKSNQLGMPHLDIVETSVANEFIICASKDTHIELLRGKLQGAGLEAIDGGDTTVAAATTPRPAHQQSRQGAFHQRGNHHQRVGGQQRSPGAANSAPPLANKPYGFVALPKKEEMDEHVAAPIWHDGTSSQGRLSGEIRFELETLTPLLVGWERGQVGDNESVWPVPANLPTVGQLKDKKSVLCPLRAPWGKGPVIIPGDSLKGLLRHELGALLGAPMERVAERSYSYRPNQKFLYDQRDQLHRQGTASLEPRLARVRSSKTAEIGGRAWPVPGQVDVLSMAMRDQQAYFPRREGRGRDAVTVRPTRAAEPYRGGLGAGQALPDKILAEDARRKMIHTHVDVTQLRVEHEAVSPSDSVIAQYTGTLAHLLDVSEGHFSARHPHIGTDQQKQRMGQEAIERGAARAFQPGDVIWVEWDTEKKCIVSLGWHYYYRWAYTDSVRKTGGELERHGLFPLDKEREKDRDGAPKELSAVRRLFGYAFDKENSGVAGIGEKDTDYTQLMGRLFVNAGLEVVAESDSTGNRFLKATFLKELGMPRPSAVEHYLKQNVDVKGRPQKRAADNATLMTYGDAADYDAPGELAGRKFYLDRPNAVAEDASDTNKQNDRSTLALDASKPGRKFRFTVRFRDLDAVELAAVIVALSPDQFKLALGGTHTEGYCSKLGYARPLGWGSVRIEAKQLLLLEELGEIKTLKPEADLQAWVAKNHRKTSTQDEWLAIHSRNHPRAGDYPREKDHKGNENIFTFHTALRAEHSRKRRYKNGGTT